MDQKHQNSYLIHFEDVIVEYPHPLDSRKRLRVLNDIDFRVRAGTFVSVVGPSGCGKSTLLKLLLGSEKPTHGIVHLNGEIIAEPGLDRGIVFQRYSLFPDKTVLENVCFGPLATRIPLWLQMMRPWKYYRTFKKIIAHEAEELLDRLQLTEHIRKRPYQLSGGQRQRVALARALIMKPKVLLMDEPFGALDHQTRLRMQLLILQEWEHSGMTVFFVTHDVSEAIFVGERIIVLSPYYETDDSYSEGSKIVLDHLIKGPHPKSVATKSTPEFIKMRDEIQDRVLKPEMRVHISNFALDHPDSFRTVDPTEWRQ